MKILVTGSDGLVGKAVREIVATDREHGHEWFFLTRNNVDLLNESKVFSLFCSIKPDVVIHLAARCGGLFMHMDHNEQVMVDNLKMNMNVVTGAEKAGAKRIVAMLSTCVFPDPAPSLPLHEEQLHMGPPSHTHEGYATSKRVLELHCRLSHVDTVCLIPTNIYGPWDNFKIDEAHVIPALIHKCYLAKQNNADFVVSGSGRALRQFIFSQDLARIVVFFATKADVDKHETYICSPCKNSEISIKDVATIIADAFGYTSRMTFDCKLHDGQLQKTADSSKLIKAMPDLRFSDFKENLVETIKWFDQNYAFCRH
jgi:GDP-L-fucose synthase